MKKILTAPRSTSKLPLGIPYIVGNEAAERFSFYGMKGILVIFMTKYLHLLSDNPNLSSMNNAAAIERYHDFTTWVYLTPILGAILADTILGKYKTIISLSLIYCLGHFALACMGAGGLSPEGWMLSGLALISIGSGGIKPCVSAHVGDQFGKSNAHLLTKVFGWFYISINVGAFISTLLTPWLLEWYGPHWAFGIPGVLMAIATFLFWMGRKTFVHIPPQGMGFLKETFSGVGLKAIAKLSIIFSFVAVFWALFDQTGSSWVIQAEDLNRYWLGIHWLPSQIQAINPIMIILLVPIFNFIIYPFLDKITILTPLRKVSIGLFIMVIGFSMIAILQQWIDQGYEPSIGWQIIAYAILTSSEVMVSITCLEFAYTQAPKSMKSVIMAIFLMSVALGNYFTAGVNSFIQIPSHSNSSLIESEQNTINLALEKIKVNFTQNNNILPRTPMGNNIISNFKDNWGSPLKYRLVNRNTFRITSLGTDQEYMTENDIVLTCNINRPNTNFNLKNKPYTWREKRIIELKGQNGKLEIEKKRGGIKKIEFQTATIIGGQTKLEGADYFWFFTKLMFGTAIAFVFVTIFYKPQEYLHEEE